MRILDNLLFSIEFPWSLVLIFGLMLVLCLVFIKAKALTVSGGFAALAVGIGCLWCLRFEGLLVLLFFFLSAGVLGKLSQGQKKGNYEKKEGARDAVQVFANGFLALLGALGYYFTNDSVFLVIFSAGMAEANSDTWAGEIGRLSKRQPVSIRNLQPVEKGLSGGITALGIIGGFLGSATVSLLVGILFPIPKIWMLVSMVCLAGFFGCLVDSLLGAFAQALYLDDKTDLLTERDKDQDGRPFELVRGLRWIDNDMVNFMSNLFAVVLAMGLVSWI
ncbi:MAG: DUF92 domain-containing protein [Sphaerochaetaceae bacterium]|jgi:uncharacterized protein (TIGR00297 family)|nr:DUF92 domain-containing protein [Sphaerochaetaceae bacterium]